MESRKILLYLSLKYNGDWEKIARSIRARESFTAEQVEALTSQCKENYITIIDEDFPEIFKKMTRTPFVLYYKGDITLLSNPKILGIVGTRTPSQYGIDVTKKIVRELKEDIVVVSGLAKGIDCVAHNECLKTNKKTIAFLGCGINNIYPVENHQLYKDIEENGLLISEYPDMVQPDKSHFPVRNRLIAGVSKGVLITEGKSKSGTSVTLSQALLYGRDVYAVPHPILGEKDNLCNDIIRDGAIVVRCGQDINEDF
jgi:DNA processing protein